MGPNQPQNSSKDDSKAGIVKTRVSLPVEPEDFVQFMSGLLGKPQSIEKGYTGQFALSYDDVINTYQLVEQRIRHQNEASLVQFIVSINYDDDSTVRLSSLEDFEKYTEVKPLVCVAVTLSWIYLVKFPQKDAPEKQQIDLSFGTSHKYTGPFIGMSPREMKFLRFGASTIHLRISHTERTWGNDIESLLDGHINTNEY